MNYWGYNLMSKIMIVIIALTVVLYLIQKYKPEIEYIPNSQMWVMFYTKEERREYFIIWKK